MLPNIIRYLRKNPDAILRRMSKMYPEIYMRHIPLMGEVENKTVKDYDLNNDSDIDAFNKDIKNSDSSNVTVSKGSGQISDS